MIRFARLALFVTLLPAVVSAAPVVARVSPSGLAFVEREAPTLIPSHMSPDPLSVTLWSCPGDDATIEQADTVVDLSIDDLKLSVPQNGVLRIDVTLSANAAGEARLNKIYACFGAEICQDSLTLRNARAVVDFTASVDAAGVPHVALKNVDLTLDRDDIEMSFSGCSPDALLTAVINGVKDIGLDIALWAVESIARNKVGPMLEEMLQGFLTFQGAFDIFSFQAKITSLDIATGGITLGGDIDIGSAFPPAACVGAVPTEPAAVAGPAPDLSQGPSTDVAVGVNLGVLQDVLHHLWSSGFMCVGPSTFAMFNIDLEPELAKLANLPGIPAGTHFSLELNAAEPPRVEGAYSDAGTLTVQLAGVTADLFAQYPDDSVHRLHLDLGLSATASVAIDPVINAVVLRIDRVSIDKLEAKDEIGITNYGFDITRVRRMIEDRVLPKLVAEMGKVPVTGPVFGGMLDTYVLLRSVKTSPSNLVVKADLFRAPAGDTEAPTTTIVSKPDRVVRPAEAKITVSGSDKLVPAELLRYRAIVNGVAGDATYVKTFTVGEDGKTATYRVQVKAIDLAGNEDPVGVTADVLVDGIAPTLNVTTQLRGIIDDARPTLKWMATDDTSSPDAIAAKVEIFHHPERAGGEFAEEKIGEETLAAGATEYQLDGLEAGKQYRVVVTAFDEAGNDDSSSFIFTIAEGASSGGGCSVGGGAGGWLVALALVGLLRRRRSS